MITVEFEKYNQILFTVSALDLQCPFGSSTSAVSSSNSARSSQKASPHNKTKAKVNVIFISVLELNHKHSYNLISITIFLKISNVKIFHNEMTVTKKTQKTVTLDIFA